ncbi:TIGR01777 family oxidoreductase [Virgibacillus kimchii]
MNVLITGGTGFAGYHLTNLLHENKYHTYVLTRSPDSHTNTAQSTFIGYDYPVEELPKIHAVVNLAGESIFGYWTKKKKEDIINSRINITRKLIEMVQRMDEMPDVFVNGSAIGYYGMSEDLIFTEKTKQAGNDFLAKVAVEWENTAKQMDKFGIRTVYTRFGVLLGNGGALPFMRLPVNLFAGGKIGDGEQWLTWVHVKDAVRLIQFCIENESMEGPVNVTAPYPKRNKDFMKTLTDVLHRPYWFTTPSLFIRLAVGEMSQLITDGQYVLPQKALDHNFEFTSPELKGALEEIEANK